MPVVLLMLLHGLVYGSDHADPMLGKKPDANIAGLFVFPEDDQMIVILNAIAGLTQPPPYDLEHNTFSIFMSLKSEVSYDDKANLARYGGTVVKPESIQPDVTIELRLGNDATLKEKSVKGLSDPDGIKVWVGVRDDPFIFPKFFGTNVVGMVLSIPMTSFPEGQQDWLIWATSKRGPKQYDHVGRSLRTMLPRFDFLNTLPPHEHVASIKKRLETPSLVQDVLQVEIQPLFAIRPYDLAPDVMIYTSRFPAGFPNGRRLTDDVAALICLQGDCLLYELSYTDSNEWPRKTVNDKPFLAEFPFLAEPWPDKEPKPVASVSTEHKVILVVLVILLLALLVVPWVLYVRCRRQRNATSKASSTTDST